jgi:anti-repressor protein
MDKLTIIENSLIPVYQSEKGNRLVNARELHAWLGIGRDFSTWVKDRIEKYGFIENTDFVLFTNSGENSEGRPRQDYIFKLDPAKEIAMVENNEKGKEIRRYFIKVEDKFKQQNQIKLPSYAEALRELADKVEENQKLLSENIELKPKAAFFDAVANSKDAIEIGQAAKVLNFGKGRNTLFAILRDEKILRDNNEPYQEYCDRGYFRMIEQKYTKPGGETHISIKTLVYQRGLDYIKKVLDRRKSA